MFVDPFDGQRVTPQQAAGGFKDPFDDPEFSLDEMFPKPGLFTRAKEKVFGKPDALDLPEIRQSFAGELRDRGAQEFRDANNPVMSHAKPRSAITQTDTPEGRVFQGLTLTSNDDEARAVVSKEFPGAQFFKQQTGETLVRIPGKPDTLLNRSGASTQDFILPAAEGGAMALMTNPVARGSAAVIGPAGRIIGTGLATGGTEFAPAEGSRNRD